jgi:hypothetical protein
MDDVPPTAVKLEADLPDNYDEEVDLPNNYDEEAASAAALPASLAEEVAKWS